MAKLPTVKDYLKNVVYSVKYAIIEDTLKPAIPIVFDTKEKNAEFAKEIRDQFRHRQNIKTVIKNIDNGEFYSSGSQILKNAKASLRTGKFFDAKREKAAEDKAFRNMMGGDDDGFDFNFDDLDKELDNLNNVEDESDEDLNNTDDVKNLNKDLNIGLKASSEAIGESVLTSAQYTGEVIKSTSGIAYAQNARQTKILTAGLGALTTGIKELIDFNTSSVKAHLENSQKYFDNTTKLLTDQNAMLKEILEMQRNMYKAGTGNAADNTSSSNRYSDVVSYNGSFNFREYFEQIKKNFFNTDLFEQFKMIYDFKDLLLANPMQFALSMVVSNFLGTDKLKGALENLNKTASGVFGKLLSGLHDKAEKSDNFLLTFLDQLLNLNQKEKNFVDTSKFEKGPMPFNGLANKAITEIIPGYLARIEAALTGNEERFYNMKLGRWENATEIKESYNEDIRRANRSGVDVVVDKARELVSKSNLTKMGVDQGDLREALNESLQLIQEKKGSVDIDSALSTSAASGKTTIDPDKLSEVLGIKNYSPGVKKFMAAIFGSLSNADKASLYNDTRQAQGEQTRVLEKIENGGLKEGNKQFLFNGSDIGSGFGEGALRNNTDTTNEILSSMFNLQKSYFDISIEYMKNNGTGIASTGENSNGLNIINKNLFKSVNTNDFNAKLKDYNSLFEEPQSESSQESINERKTIGTGFNEGRYDYGNEVFFSFAEANLIEHDPDPKDRTKAHPALDGIISFMKNIKSLDDINPSTKNPDYNLVVKYFEHIREKYATREITNFGVSAINDAAQLLVSTPGSIKFIVKTSYKELVRKKEYPSIRNVLYGFFREFSGVDNRTDDLNELMAISTDAAENINEGDSYEELKGKNFSEKFSNAKGLAKFGVISSYLKHVSKTPFNLLAKTVESADKIMYQFFFGNGKEHLDANGNKITGFFGNLIAELQDTFKKAKDWIKRRIFNDKDKEEYFTTVKDSFGNIAKYISNSFTSVLGHGAPPKETETKDQLKKDIGDEAAKRIEMLNEANETGAAGGLGYIPKTGLYMLSKGEAVIPSTMNPSNPWRGQTTIAQDAANEKRVGRNMGINVINGYAPGTAKTDNKKTEEKEIKKENTTLFSELKRLYPSTLGEGTVGAAIGGVLGGPIGLMIGASFGAANNILKKSDFISNKIFGDDQKLSLFARTKNGLSKLIPNSILNKAKEGKNVAKDVKDYGLVGGGLGLLSSLVGGPLGLVGGLAIGASIGYLRNSVSAQEALFGTHSNTNKLRQFFDRKYIKPLGLGGLAGTLVFGGPLGLVGGMVAGGAVKFVSDSNTIKDFLFGPADDKGKRKYDEGFFGKLTGKILKPFSDLGNKIDNYLKEALFDPLKALLRPLSTLVNVSIRKMYKISESVLNYFVGASKPGLNKFQKLFKYMTNGKVGKLVTGAGGGAIGGLMMGGPLGAIAGGIIGAGLHYKGWDKKLFNGLLSIGKLPGKAMSWIGNKLTNKLVANGLDDTRSAQEMYDWAHSHNIAFKDQNIAKNIDLVRNAKDENIGRSRKLAEVMNASLHTSSRSVEIVNKQMRQLIMKNFNSEESMRVSSILNQVQDNPKDQRVIEEAARVINKTINDSSTIKPEDKESLSKEFGRLLNSLVAAAGGKKLTQEQLNEYAKEIQGAGVYSFKTDINGNVINAKEQFEDMLTMYKNEDTHRARILGDKYKSTYTELDSTTKMDSIKATDNITKRVDVTNDLLSQILAAIKGENNNPKYVKSGKIVDEDDFNNKKNNGVLLDKNGEVYTGTFEDYKKNNDAYVKNENYDENYEDNEQKTIAKNMDVTNGETDETIAKKAKNSIEWGEKEAELEKHNSTRTALLGLNSNYNIKQNKEDISDEEIDKFHKFITNNNDTFMWLNSKKLSVGKDTPKVKEYIQEYGKTNKIDSSKLDRLNYIYQHNAAELNKENVETILNLDSSDWKIIKLVTEHYPGAVIKDIKGFISSYRSNDTTKGGDGYNNILRNGDPNYLGNIKEVDFSGYHNKLKEKEILPAKKTFGVRGTLLGFPDGTVRKSNDGSRIKTKDEIDAEKKEEKLQKDTEEFHQSVKVISDAFKGWMKDKKKSAKDKIKDTGSSLFDKIKDLASGGLFKMVLGGISGMIPIFGPSIAKVLAGLGPKVVGSLFKTGGVALIAYEGARRLFNKLTGNEEANSEGMMSDISDQRAYSGLGKGAISGIKTAVGVGKKLADKTPGLIKHFCGALCKMIGDYASSFADKLLGSIFGGTDTAKWAAGVLKKGQQVLATKGPSILNKAVSKVISKGPKIIASKMLKAIAQFLITPAGSFVIQAGVGFFTADDTFNTKDPTFKQRVASAFLNGLAGAIPIIGIFLDGSDMLKVARMIWPDFCKEGNEGDRDKESDNAEDKDENLDTSMKVGGNGSSSGDSGSNNNGSNNGANKKPDLPDKKQLPDSINEDTSSPVGEATSDAFETLKKVNRGEASSGDFLSSLKRIGSAIISTNKQSSDKYNEENKKRKEESKAIVERYAAAGKAKGTVTGYGMGTIYDLHHKHSRTKLGYGKFDKSSIQGKAYGTIRPFRGMRVVGGYAGGTGGKNNAELIWEYLTSKNIGSAAIAGIMGNIQAESSFDPTIIEGGSHGDSPIEGKGFGLCQWTYADRQQPLVQLANSRGKPASDLYVQLDFMLQELQNDNPGLIEKMSKMKPYDAALLFHKEFERSADTPQMAARRGEYAEAIFQNQGKGIMTANGYSGSGSSSSSSGASGLIGGLLGIAEEAMNPFKDFLGMGTTSSSSGSSGGAGGLKGAKSGFKAEDIKAGSTADYMLKTLQKQDPEARVTAPYGEQRSDEVHGGIDIGANGGSIVYSPVKGVVHEVNNDGVGGGYGNYVQVKDEQGNFHMFPHLSSTDISAGTAVEVGTDLGKVGSTGRSTGDHLHYEIDPPENVGASSHGRHLDPNTYGIADNGTPNASKLKAVAGHALGTVTGFAEGTTSVDYSDKIDTIIENQNALIKLFTAMLEAITNNSINSGGTVVVNNANNSGNEEIAKSVTNKMATSTPGKSIMDIMQNMLTVATN